MKSKEKVKDDGSYSQSPTGEIINPSKTTKFPKSKSWLPTSSDISLFQSFCVLVLYIPRDDGHTSVIDVCITLFRMGRARSKSSARKEKKRTDKRKISSIVYAASTLRAEEVFCLEFYEYLTLLLYVSTCYMYDGPTSHTYCVDNIIGTYPIGD